MADNPAQFATTWPSAKFSFSVKFGQLVAKFQKVSGLNETQSIEYRGSKNTNSSTVKMPGLPKFKNVTLKKGLFQNNMAIWDLLQQVKNEYSTTRDNCYFPVG